MESGALRMRSIWKQLCKSYVRFVEKQGFPIIVTLCVAVITVTALWTGNHEPSTESPTPPVVTDLAAAQLLQQSLQEAVSPTPAPTGAQRTWLPPLTDLVIIRDFDTKAMCQSDVTGIWSFHDAIDLQADRGAKVYAMSEGVVKDCGHNKILGTWLHIDHFDGIEALYAGLALNNDYAPGDEVRSGAVIGYSGSGPLDEGNMNPHLHLRVTQNGTAMNPVDLWDNRQHFSPEAANH